MDLRKLKTLIDLVSDSNVSELEITEAEGKVRIVKSMGVAAPVVMQQHSTVPVALASAVASAVPAEAPAVPVAPAAPVAVGHTVKSPMVGTFYLSSSPGAAPFIQIGSVVKEGIPCASSRP